MGADNGVYPLSQTVELLSVGVMTWCGAFFGPLGIYLDILGSI
jgi:hypothetical protein